MLTLIFFVFHIIQHSSGEWSEEVRLLNHMLFRYNRVARPIRDINQAVNVEVAFSLSKIDKINAKDQTFVGSGWLLVKWYDEHLIWNPLDFNNITNMVVHPDQIWLPSFVLRNTNSPNIYDADWYRWFRVFARHTGSLLWKPGGKFSCKCKIDVTFYPFDDQICDMVFSNWVYTLDKVNLSVSSDATSQFLEAFSPSSEWNIEDFVVIRSEAYYSCCPEAFPEIHFRFRLRRKTLFYIINDIIPCQLLSILTLFVFKLPPDSGEKVNMSLTLLLSFSVLILMVSEDVPNTSDAVPLLVVYLIFFMGVTCLSSIFSVWILILHHSQTMTRSPKWLRIFTYRCIGQQTSTLKNTFEMNRVHKPLVTTDHIDDKSQDPGPSKRDKTVSDIEVTDEDNVFESVKGIEANMQAWCTIRKSKKFNQRILGEWREIAILWDNMMFNIFTAVLFLVTVTMFLIVPLFKSDPDLTVLA